MPLWVFPAERIADDEDAAVWHAGAAIVRPLGPAVAAEELGL